MIELGEVVIGDHSQDRRVRSPRRSSHWRSSEGSSGNSTAPACQGPHYTIHGANGGGRHADVGRTIPGPCQVSDPATPCRMPVLLRASCGTWSPGRLGEHAQPAELSSLLALGVAGPARENGVSPQARLVIVLKHLLLPERGAGNRQPPGQHPETSLALALLLGLAPRRVRKLRHGFSPGGSLSHGGVV
jgi:hypothetical protein